jgi:hypothetical protein
MGLDSPDLARSQHQGNLGRSSGQHRGATVFRGSFASYDLYKSTFVFSYNQT